MYECVILKLSLVNQAVFRALATTQAHKVPDHAAGYTNDKDPFLWYGYMKEKNRRPPPFYNRNRLGV